MSLDPAAVASLVAVCVGFAAAGLSASGFELLTRRRASFALLGQGGVVAVASLPLLAVSAPFIILRNTVRGRRIERRPIPFVAAATAIAALWSLASGRAIIDGVGFLVGS